MGDLPFGESRDAGSASIAGGRECVCSACGPEQGDCHYGLSASKSFTSVLAG